LPSRWRTPFIQAADPLYVGFDTQSSVADIADFYADQLSADGWAAGPEPYEGSDRAAIEYVKGNQVLYLLITPGDNGRRVDLALSPSD
jgi:hypothetical protein